MDVFSPFISGALSFYVSAGATECHCCRGCSVVEFASSSDMKNAIEKMNDTELNGRHITITEDRGRGDSGRRKRRWATRLWSCLDTV